MVTHQKEGPKRVSKASNLIGTRGHQLLRYLGRLAVYRMDLTENKWWGKSLLRCGGGVKFLSKSRMDTLLIFSFARDEFSTEWDFAHQKGVEKIS